MKLVQAPKILLSAVLLLVLPVALVGATGSEERSVLEDEKRPAISHYNLEKGLALSGYDPVAYFPGGGGEPKKGKKELTATHLGVSYRFASKENKELFVAEPSRFEPAYGGWCAYAMSRGKKVEVDPKSFLVENGKLHVFYKGLFNNTRKKWQKEGGAKLRPKATGNWKKISGEGEEEKP